MFERYPITSRYFDIETAKLKSPTGETLVYLSRRFLPQPDRFSVLRTHVVTQGERLDNIVAQHIGDPEQHWRICDANGAMRPADLTAENGRKLRITLPEGVPGAPNA